MKGVRPLKSGHSPKLGRVSRTRGSTFCVGHMIPTLLGPLSQRAATEPCPGPMLCPYARGSLGLPRNQVIYDRPCPPCLTVKFSRSFHGHRLLAARRIPPYQKPPCPPPIARRSVRPGVLTAVGLNLYNTEPELYNNTRDVSSRAQPHSR